jgi:hypothetical protein
MSRDEGGGVLQREIRHAGSSDEIFESELREGEIRQFDDGWRVIVLTTNQP